MKHTLLIISLVALCSCSRYEPLGKIKDTIGMERNEIVFGPKNDTTTFKTKGTDYILLPDMSNWPETHDLTYINTSYKTLHDTVYYDWVKIVALKDQHLVKVIVYDNDTGSDRYYKAGLESYAFVGHLKIYQN